MDYNERIQRTRRAPLVSSARTATPDGMAGCPSHASIPPVQPAGKAVGFPNVLNIANDSKIMKPVGTHRHSNP